MNFVMKMVEQIMELFRKTKQRKRAVSVITALVLIVSTIAPAASAFAVEENTASTQAYSEEIAEEVEPEEYLSRSTQCRGLWGGSIRKVPCSHPITAASCPPHTALEKPWFLSMPSCTRESSRR